MGAGLGQEEMRIIETTTDLSYGRCLAQEGKMPTGCRLKVDGYCKKHKGENNISNGEVICPLDEDGFGVVIYRKYP